VNLPSRSRSRNLKRLARSPGSISTFRACRAVRAPAGWPVTPGMRAVRVWISVTSSTYTRCSKTVRRAGNHMPGSRTPERPGTAAMPAMHGALPGPGPAADRIRRIVPFPARCPSPVSSPWIRWQPPARVLPGQLLSQLPRLLRDGRSSRCVRIGPLPGDQAPVPGQQRARSHDPVQPQAPGQQPPEGRDHGTVPPSPTPDGRPGGAGPRPRAAGPGSPRPWRHHPAPGAPASRTPGL
jgi:hypothetical protein